MSDERQHWLGKVPEATLWANPIEPAEAPQPLTLLLGAGASRSSHGPGTEEILKECRRRRPSEFRSDQDVYDKFSNFLTPDERDQLIRPLFTRISPYIGYRCIAAIGRGRLIYVVNLNWDHCIRDAAAALGVPFADFDLKYVDEGRAVLDEAEARGHGIVCAHVHGRLEDPRAGEDNRHGIRFSHPDTLTFGAEEMELLERMLAPATIVAGTSLSGTPDSHDLIRALTWREDKQRKSPKALWVFERAAPADTPGFATRSSVGLSKALLSRYSMGNYVRDTDVDFDMLMTTIRAEEVGVCWEDIAPPKTQLPSLEKLVLPAPDALRDLLDRDRALLAGAPRIGSSTVAYLIAWWRCLVDAKGLGEAPGVKGFQGLGQALACLRRAGLDTEKVGAVVVEDALGESTDREEVEIARRRFAEVLELTAGAPLIATASPAGAGEAACAETAAPELEELETTVFWPRSLWDPADLRAWARARGGGRAELVCREVRMGLISTPCQATRAIGGHEPYEHGPAWRRRLRAHLDRVYRERQSNTLALVLLRLQDFSVPRAASEIERAAGAGAAEQLIGDPWGVCAEIEVDKSRYLRLANPNIVGVVDEWMADCDGLDEALREADGAAGWAPEALRRWARFDKTAPDLIPDDFDDGELSLFGSEYVRRALHRGAPDTAIELLWRIWKARKDHWTAKDIALDLVLHWEQLRHNSRARELRDSLLRAKTEMGPYALFEAMMRVGRPTPEELWSAAVTRLCDLAFRTSRDPAARRQVALAFDAMLWRRCPVTPEQERKLIDLLLEAADRDPSLGVVMAAAAAYHHDGAERLRKQRFVLPSLEAGPPLRVAREVAWLVEWHFAHQSRCRALASRRTFLSTLELLEATDRPRYLDRAVRQDPLDAGHEEAIVGLVGVLLHHDETAGWGLHLIMNVHTTTGQFDVPGAQIARLHALLGAGQLCDGVVSAALTYAPGDQTYDLLVGALKEEPAREALQKAHPREISVEGVEIGEPRFSLAANPWEALARWGALPDPLPLRASGPQELIDRLAVAIEAGVKSGIFQRDAGERALGVISRGHIHPVATWGKEFRTYERDLEEEAHELAAFVVDYVTASFS